MSASTSTASTKQQLRTVARAQRRHMATEKKRQAARQRAEQQEARDEAIAPRAQRLPVLGRDGVELDRATLADWVGQAEFLLSPLAEAIGRHIRAEALLGTCRGFLHADGYAGFERLFQPITPGGDPPLIEVSCWSHVRRKFYDVHHVTASPVALEALERIAALFAIDSSVRGRPPEQRAAVRIEYAQPLLAQLKTFLEPGLNQVSGKSAVAKAILYALSRWEGLSRYITNGRLEMSNNAAERAMKPPVLGRKNYLFYGSDAGGQRAACIYPIIESCKMNGVEPQAYLTDVLARIADHPIQKINDLLPWHSKK